MHAYMLSPDCTTFCPLRQITAIFVTAQEELSCSGDAHHNLKRCLLLSKPSAAVFPHLLQHFITRVPPSVPSSFLTTSRRPPSSSVTPLFTQPCLVSSFSTLQYQTLQSSHSSTVLCNTTHHSNSGWLTTQRIICPQSRVQPLHLFPGDTRFFSVLVWKHADRQQKSGGN